MQKRSIGASRGKGVTPWVARVKARVAAISHLSTTQLHNCDSRRTPCWTSYMPHLRKLRDRRRSVLADDDLRQVIDQMEHLEGSAEVNLVTRGEWSDSLFLLVDGRVAATIEADGRTLELSQNEQGQSFGEFAFIEPGPSSATVTSLEPYAALRLKSDVLPKLIEENPRAAATLLRTLTRETAEQLLHASSGVMERVDKGTFIIRETGESPSWFSELPSRLFGREGAA
jgi:CRP-like cAMP-binding protein